MEVALQTQTKKYYITLDFERFVLDFPRHMETYDKLMHGNCLF